MSIDRTFPIPSIINFQSSHFDEVRRRRVFAFCLDLLIVTIVSTALLGLAMLYAHLQNLTPDKTTYWSYFSAGILLKLIFLMWIANSMLSTTNPWHATIGMRYANIKALTITGSEPTFIRAAFHTMIGAVILFSLPIILLKYSTTSPVTLVLLVPFVTIFFSKKKHMPQDYISSLVFIRSNKL